MSAPTALVLISHSAVLAAGVAELAAQMAADVILQPAGGTGDGRIGTGFDVVEGAVAAAFDGGAGQVVMLTDLGSARMTAESVLEMLEDERLFLVDGAFVEGAVAGAVAAQTGADAAGVAAAVAAATRQVAAELPETAAPQATQPEPEATSAKDAGGAVVRTISVINPQGLHARPAAQVAQLAATFDAAVTLNGVDAASLLSLMGLALAQGNEVELVATGGQAGEAADAVAALFSDGFGEL